MTGTIENREFEIRTPGEMMDDEIYEPESMKEIRRIREKHYEETKGMSPEERTEYIRKKAKNVVEKNGLKLKTTQKHA